MNDAYTTEKATRKRKKLLYRTARTTTAIIKTSGRRKGLTSESGSTAAGVVGESFIRLTDRSVSTATVQTRPQLGGTVRSRERQRTDTAVSNHEVDAVSAVLTRVGIAIIYLRLTVHACAPHDRGRVQVIYLP